MGPRMKEMSAPGQEFVTKRDPQWDGSKSIIRWEIYGPKNCLRLIYLREFVGQDNLTTVEIKAQNYWQF